MLFSCEEMKVKKNKIKVQLKSPSEEVGDKPDDKAAVNSPQDHMLTKEEDVAGLPEGDTDARMGEANKPSVSAGMNKQTFRPKMKK